MENAIKRKSNNFRKHILAMVVASVMSGCASLNHTDGFSEEQLKLSQYATLTSSQAINQLQQNVRSPENKEIPIYAPNHYQTANKALEDAQKLLKENGPRDQIVQKVAVGNAILQNGNRVVERVKDNLSTELSLKQKLDALETDDVYSSEYGSLVDRLNTVIQSVEAGKTEEVAENREKLLKDMQRLEQKARRYNAMHEPEEILKRVKYSGGEKLAPITYAEALEVFKRADQFIQQNPSYEAGIEQVGKEALFAAKRALYITQEVAALTQKVNLAPEQVILDEEYRMRRIARELTDDDFRDHPIEVQSELLADAAKLHAKELKNKDDLVIALRDTLINVRDSSTELSDLSKENQSLKAEKDNWLAKDALYRAKLEDLEAKLSTSINELDLTQKKLLASSTERESLAQKLSEKNSQLTSLQSQNNATESSVSQELQAQTTNNQLLKEKIAQLETQLATIQTEAAQSQQDIAATSKDKESLVIELENNKQTIADLTTKLNTTNNELEQLRILSSSSEQNADQQLQDLIAKNNAVIAENEKLRIENQQQQEKIAQIEKDLADVNFQVAKSNEEMANTAAAKAFLTIDHEGTKQELEQLKAQLSETNNKLSQAQQQALAAQTNVALVDTLQKEKASWLAQEKATNENIKKLEMQLAETQLKLQQTSQDLTALNARNQQLTQELAIAKQNSSTLDKQLADAQATSKANEESAKVSEAETMEALESARELIKELKSNAKAAKNSGSDSSTNALGEDVFVDAGE